MKARHGGLLFGQSFGHRGAGQKGESQHSTSVPASLVCQAARWMQIMNVNPASLFPGQTPKKRNHSGCQCGKSCLFALCISLGSASFFFEAFSACAFHSQCVWESRTPAALTPPPEVSTFVLYLLLCNSVLLSVMKGEEKNGLPIWLRYLDDLSRSSSE